MQEYVHPVADRLHDVENLDGMDQLRELSGWVLGACVILLIVALAAGAGVYAAKGLSDRGRKIGLRITGGACIGLAVLGGLSGVLKFSGEKVGTESLMPEDARPGVITIKKDPPLIRCPKEEWVQDGKSKKFPSQDEIKQLMGKDEYEKFVKQNYDRDAFGHEKKDFDASQYKAYYMKWRPMGPDCNNENFKPEPGTNLIFVFQPTNGGHGANQTWQGKAH